MRIVIGMQWMMWMVEWLSSNLVIWWSGNPSVHSYQVQGVLDPGKGCLGLMDRTRKGKTDDAVP